MSENTNIESRRNVLRVIGAGVATAAILPVATSCQSKANEAKTETAPAPQEPAAPAPAEWKAVSAPMASAVYPFELPPLPYEFNALEPAIDAQTMEIHHDRHHAGYTRKLNAALENHTDLHGKTIGELIGNLDALPKSVQTAVRNNGGGFYNHALFWPLMSASGGGSPTGDLAAAITRDFGSFDEFKAQFSKAAGTVFGSGWGWLAADSAGKLHIVQSSNQDNPLSSGHKPILGLDVWEHAYYLKYQNKRGDYIKNFWDIVNWEQAAANYG